MRVLTWWYYYCGARGKKRECFVWVGGLVKREDLLGGVVEDKCLQVKEGTSSKDGQVLRILEVDSSTRFRKVDM